MLSHLCLESGLDGSNFWSSEGNLHFSKSGKWITKKGKITFPGSQSYVSMQ
jgi:hypothetical protein